MKLLHSMSSPLRSALQGRFERWLTTRLPASSKKTLDNRSIFIFPTRLGFIYLFVMLLVFLLGTNYQNNVIILFAYLLASVFITVMLQSYFNFKGLSIIGPEKVTGYAHQQIKVPFTLSSSNPKLSLTLRYPGQALATLEQLDSKANVHVPYVADIRGEKHIERLNIASEHVLGLFKTWTWCDFGTQAIIYPEAKPLAARSFGQQKALGDEQSGHSPEVIAGNDDFHELNTYRQGEPLSQIAWKHLARGQGKFTKQYCQPVSSDAWLSLSDMPSNNIELKLSYLSYLVGQNSSQNVTFGLDLQGKKIQPNSGKEHIYACMYDLATFGQKKG